MADFLSTFRNLPVVRISSFKISFSLFLKSLLYTQKKTERRKDDKIF